MDKLLMANAELSKFCRNYMQLKRDLPIRPSEMGVLNIISQTPGPHTAAHLAEMMGVSKPMIAAHISVLLKKGYIAKQQSADDGRVFFIVPTEKALDLVADTGKKTDAQLTHMIRQMGRNEFDAMVALIEKANRILEGYTDGHE